VQWSFQERCEITELRKINQKLAGFREGFLMNNEEAHRSASGAGDCWSAVTSLIAIRVLSRISWAKMRE
jgi:hypothetical protein